MKDAMGMNRLERALYEVGAHILYKQAHPDRQVPLKKWKVPAVNKNRPACRKQRMVGDIPCDPVDKVAALVTSPRPKV